MLPLPSRFKRFLAAWLTVMGVVALSLYSVELKRQENVLKDYAVGVAASVKNKLDANEAVLAGLSAFLLAVDQSDTEAVTRYAAAISAAYPHIYMLEIARRVPASERKSFESAMRRQWRPDFTIKDFGQVTKQPSQGLPLALETWPILFMYPALPEADALYGTSLETVPYLSRTLVQAKRNTLPVVSPVFSMFEGGSAYILLQEIGGAGKPRAASYFGERMTALLLVRIDSLLDPDSKASHIRVDGTLKGAGLNSQITLREHGEPPPLLDSAFLPSISLSLEIGNRTQPLSLHFEKQVLWSEVSTPASAVVSLLYLCALLVVPALVLRHLRSLDLAAVEHRRSAYLATHDVLTDLPNRYLFEDRFKQAFINWQRNDTPFALILIDLDDFKAINDTHGHVVGDQVLQACALRMTRELRALDTIARYGGDEFLGLLTSVAAVEDALQVAEKLLAQLCKPAVTVGGDIHISVSIGVALCPMHGRSLDALKAAADVAMYEAKKSGKNCVRAYQVPQVLQA